VFELIFSMGLDLQMVGLVESQRKKTNVGETISS
jgi:hypothetical protein